MVNLRPMLDATEPAWRTNLACLFERMHFILGEQVSAFEQELAAAFGARFAVAVGTGTAAIELALRASGLADSGAEVHAQMPGRVVEVKVAAGDRVEPGSVLLVLEAMKMQNEIRCDTGGVVESVEVQAGQPVEGGALLAVVRAE